MKKTIEKYNDQLSTKYDIATQGEFKWTAPSVFIKNIKPFMKKNIDVLDIGVGTGQTSEIFFCKGIKVTGIDISQKMLDVAWSKYKFKKLIKYDAELGLSNIFSEDKFDIITAVGVLEFVKNIKKTLKEMKQLLKKDGIIAFTYEVYKPNSKLGTKKTSPIGAGSLDSHELLKFMVYRRTPAEIRKILDDLSLRILRKEAFIAYLKSKLKIPVLYEFLLVK